MYRLSLGLLLMDTASTSTPALQRLVPASSRYIRLLIRLSNRWATVMCLEQLQVRILRCSAEILEFLHSQCFIGVDQCGNPVGVSGTFNFNGMIEFGFLDAQGTAAPGINYVYDNCSQTVSRLTLCYSMQDTHLFLHSLSFIIPLRRL